MTYASTFLRNSIATRIAELEADKAERLEDIVNAGISIADHDNVITSTLDDIEALNRVLADREESVKFLNSQLADHNWNVSEIDKAIASLKAELEPAKAPPEAVKTVPAKRLPKTHVGLLTKTSTDIIRRLFAPLATLNGIVLAEYIQEIRTQGYDFRDTAISVALGKPSYWLGQEVHKAKKLGYDIPANPNF